MRRWVAALLIACACGPIFAQESPPESDRGSFRVEYLNWYLARLPVPPLATTGATGIVGDPATVVLRGGELTSRHDRYVGMRAGDDPARDDLTGSINVYSRIEFFTEDANAALRLWQFPDRHLNLLVGARFV